MDFNGYLDVDGNNSALVQSLTLVMMYTKPDEDLFQRSLTALSICHLDDGNYMVVPLMHVRSVVGMIPFKPPRT